VLNRVHKGIKVGKVVRYKVLGVGLVAVRILSRTRGEAGLSARH